MSKESKESKESTITVGSSFGSGAVTAKNLLGHVVIINGARCRIINVDWGLSLREPITLTLTLEECE